MSLRWLVIVLLACVLGVPLWAQDLPANPDEIHTRKPVTPKPPARTTGGEMSPDPDKIPNTSPAEPGESSSKDTRIDLAPPPQDVREHPDSYTELKPWDPHKADKDVEVGDYYFKLQNYRAAESRYREALYWEDKNATAMFKLAQSLEKLGEVEEAAHNYRGYGKLAPDGPFAKEAKSALARLAPQLGPTPGAPRSDEAEDDLRLGEFNMALGNWPEAANKFRDALSLKSDDAYAAFRLAQCLEQMKQGSEARGYYQQYLKQLPNGPFAKDANQALARLPAAPEKQTGNADAAKIEEELKQGESLLEAKDYPGAIVHLRNALKLEPANARGVFRLAQALEGSGERDQALRSYREYLRIDPNGPFAVEALNALNRLSTRASASPAGTPQ